MLFCSCSALCVCWWRKAVIICWTIRTKFFIKQFFMFSAWQSEEAGLSSKFPSLMSDKKSVGDLSRPQQQGRHKPVNSWEKWNVKEPTQCKPPAPRESSLQPLVKKKGKKNKVLLFSNSQQRGWHLGWKFMLWYFHFLTIEPHILEFNDEEGTSDLFPALHIDVHDPSVRAVYHVFMRLYQERHVFRWGPF